MRYLPIPKLTQVDIERLWSHIKCGSNNDCWLWMAARSNEGYGRFKLTGQLFSVTRLVYYLTHKCDPAPKHVCHTCDNPSCCNPKHLWLGTAGDNNDDSVRKGRYKRVDSVCRGLRHANWKYSVEMRQQLRELAELVGVQEAAKQLGVKVRSAYYIVQCGQTYQTTPCLLKAIARNLR